MRYTGRIAHIIHERRDNIGFRRLLAAISRTFELGQDPQRNVLLYDDNDRARDVRAGRKLLSLERAAVCVLSPT